MNQVEVNDLLKELARSTPQQLEKALEVVSFPTSLRSPFLSIDLIEKKTFTIEEVAQLTNRDPSGLRGHVRVGNLCAVKKGKTWIINELDLKHFLMQYPTDGIRPGPSRKNESDQSNDHESVLNKASVRSLDLSYLEFL